MFNKYREARLWQELKLFPSEGQKCNLLKGKLIFIVSYWFWKAVNNLWSNILNKYFYIPQKKATLFLKTKNWQFFFFFFLREKMWWDKLNTFKMALNFPFVSSVCWTWQNRSRSWFLFGCLCLNSWARTRTRTRVFQSDLTRNTLQHDFKSF